MLFRSGKLILGMGLGLTLLAAACATAPYTGRRQVILESEGSDISTGNKTYEDLRCRNDTCQDPAVSDLVTRVGSRLAAAADRPDYQWEFVVLENDQETRAFCLPGGKAGVFTGVLKYTRGEAELATVLAHEMAHALAHMGSMGLGLTTAGAGSVAGQTVAEGYSLGIKYGILPTYSRAQELEADKIGLILMAKAGYDPALAMDFWRRMMTDEDVKLRPPQFLTVPRRDDRHMQALVDFLPEARKHYVPVAEAPAASAPPAAVPPQK